MKNHRRRHVLRTCAGLFAALALNAPSVSWADKPFPSKPVTFIVPYAAGGGTDVVVRVMGQKLSELWGQPVLVMNRPGANGVIGSHAVERSEPDGHTLLVVVPSHTVNPVLMRSLPYDTRKDFAPVTNIMTAPLVLVVSASSKWNSAQQLVDDAKAEPDKFNIANSEGSSLLTGELWKDAAGLDLIAVPYKGSGPLYPDLLSERISMTFLPITSALPYFKSGTLRAIGLASDGRLAALPDLPTLTEQGFDVESYAWTGVFAPAGTPAEIVRKIQQDIAQVIQIPEVWDQISLGMAVRGGEPPEEFEQYIEQELDKWATVARVAKVEPQ